MKDSSNTKYVFIAMVAVIGLITVAASVSNTYYELII